MPLTHARWADRAATPARPNLIVILTDAQGYGDVGFNGRKDIPSPNLDSMARYGVPFTSGYFSYPVCSPSRAGLFGRGQIAQGQAAVPPPNIVGIVAENPDHELPCENVIERPKVIYNARTTKFVRWFHQDTPD